MAKSHCGRKRMFEIDHNLSNTQTSTRFTNGLLRRIEGRLRIEYGKLLLVIKQSIEPFTEAI